jgi:predicted metal-dependent peptidase
MQTEIEMFSKEHADEAGDLKRALQVENRERYDYREFLRKFSVLKEEMQVDMDTFDYIFYHYGMSIYGNMPLIEPQETKEVQKIEDFVIVIDTSMSCKGELVKKFLEQTYEVLSQAESFYRKINVRILQCDEKVQEDAKIENAKQLQEYMENLEIKGMGGTDFRPAFLYVQELMARKEFHKLKGLLYFTDGYGKYPIKKPMYDVAFVFIEKDYQDVDVPYWAMKLILTEDEIQYEY